MSSSAQSGAPMAMHSCAAGMLHDVIHSVVGCSTCRRGLSSRKKKASSSGMYRNSAVAAPTYPTAAASDRAACSIARRVPGGTAEAGASSITFWWRRCTVQSRPCSAATLPWLSHSSCTSTWRHTGAQRMRNTGLPGTSAVTCGNTARASSALSTRRMPRPPPPALALIMRGKPTETALAAASSALATHAASYASSGISRRRHCS
mmetsp:Transcript_6101/g.24354  ORF Transcript_6101/g.24354 Transcript_6101/m.24354 type:complete len:205 (+) Transcript_6101:6588-7202(+)